MKGIRERTALAGGLTGLLALACAAAVLVLEGSSEDVGARFLIAGLAGVLAAAVLGFVYGEAALRRLQVLTAAVRALGAGDFSHRLDAGHEDEFSRLAEAFNETSRRLQERVAAAAHERNRLEAALNSSIDAVAALNHEGRVVFANRALERLFEKPTSDMVGHPFAWLLAERNIIEAIRASGEQGRRNVFLIERPGRRYFQVATTPITGGGEWSVLVVIHDLTDVKRVEQTRRDFVANVSHELRTPLAGIKSVVEVLLSGALEDRALAEDFLRRADAEVDRLVQLVEELLELSRIESGEVPLNPAPSDIGQLLREVVERMRPQAERKGQLLSLTLDEESSVVEMDAGRIERAVVNLLHNAIKFTPEGGSIQVSGASNESEYVVRVSDSGIGIAPEELPRIFERFYKSDQSRAAGGSGLGLALVRHAIESHGGRVQVESRQGAGSTFTVTIPMRMPAAAAGTNA